MRLRTPKSGQNGRGGMSGGLESDIGISRFRHSRRIVPITHSQIAFAFGQRGGDFSTVRPSALIDSSRCLANILSRS